MPIRPLGFSHHFDKAPFFTALPKRLRQWQHGSYGPPIVLLKFLGCLVSSLTILAWPSELYAADLAGDQIGYIKSGHDPFVANLVPDRSPGSVPNDISLVETTTNGKITAFQLAPGQDGSLGLSGHLPGLMDGRHKASVKTLTSDGSQKDYKQVLFIVDSKPPVIERVTPESDLFPRTAGAIQFKVTDPEGGSGVSIDPMECALNIAVSGASLQDKTISLEANALNLTVFVAFPGGAAAYDASFTVSVSLQDRAGNVGRASETFTTQSLTSPDFKIYKCKHRDTYIQTGGAFLVEPAYSGMTLRVGMDRQLDIFTRGCFGKDYHYPENLRAIMRREEGYDKEAESEIVTMNPFFQKSVGELVEIHSASGKTAIRKLEDGDLEDSRVSFRISQQNPYPMGDQMDTLLVTVPVDFRIDASQVGFCEAKNKVDAFNEEDTIYNHIPEDAFIYTFETIAIPVYLESAAEPFRLTVGQEGDRLKARAQFSPIELMDTGASWFEFLGDKYWFERQGDVCVAGGPAHEGTVHFKIGATHKIAEFSDPEGGDGTTSRTMMTEGDIVVCLDPPVIENFRYNRERNTLTADIDDQGTPRKDLAISLWFAGHRLEATFDRETGKLTAGLPYTPISVLTASLSVTDLAEQTTTESCQVFGEVEEPEESTGEGGTASARSPYAYSPNLYGVDRVLGTKGNGKAVVEICEGALKWGYYRHGHFIPIDSSPSAMRLIQLRPRHAGRGYDLRRALAEHLPLDFEIMGTSYERDTYEPIPARQGGVSSVSATGGSSAQSVGRDIYFVATAWHGGRKIPLNDAISSFGLFFELKEIQQCRTEERDILAPVIQPSFDPSSRHLTAAIHDHGMPLSELEIAVTAQSDSANNNVNWGYQTHSAGSRPALTFQNGILSSPFDPPDRGEFFTLRIDARDKADNRSFVDVDVILPRDPPEVSLTAETRSTCQSMTRSGENASAFMTGEARDDSRIIPEKTTLWLDEQVLQPFLLYSHTPEAGWRSQFNYKAGYAAGVAEGYHLARFRATDATGLWAETTTGFDFNLAPYIYDFKVMPDAVRKVGGPALTAMVIDLGGDLDVSGLSLAIDGQPVDPDHFYFDPASGYFSVDGPLDLAEGLHRAEITAVDSHGNRAGDSLRFTRAAEITTAYQSDGHDLSIESLALMELEDHNGDGRANPGELVRLYITLGNDSDKDLACFARLSSEDLEIKVETDRVSYGHMASGSKVVPMKGFDLRIGREILDKTISDPYEAYFDLTLGCDPEAEYVLPLTLPIHQPTIPIDASMMLILDRLPPTTTAGTILVPGTITSDAEFIDWMEIRVNGTLQGPVAFSRAGGRFESTVTLTDGANTIEVSGADSNGARGSAAGYIYRTVSFVPPTITITSPVEGDYFVCGDLTVTGNYSAGSGTLDSITVDAPWGGGNCPVTIIDGTRFTINCGDIIYGPAGIYDVEATIETTDGIRATDAITIRVGDCS